MCTLSWCRGSVGTYTVLFNRDERRTRPAAHGPTLRVIDRVQALSPVDPEGGGTWLGVNACGVTLALANRYGPPGGPGQISRGQLVASLLGVPDIAQARDRLATMDLQRYAGFTLAVFSPEGAWQLAWDGEARTEHPITQAGLVLTSSAVAQEAVAAARRETFGTARDVAALRRLHASHQPARGGSSVCMHRPDAETVSFSEVAVGPQAVTLRYQPGAPCHGRPVTVCRLTRLVTAA